MGHVTAYIIGVVCQSDLSMITYFNYTTSLRRIRMISCSRDISFVNLLVHNLIMSSEDHTLDPDGDVFLILTNRSEAGELHKDCNDVENDTS